MSVDVLREWWWGERQATRDLIPPDEPFILFVVAPEYRG